MNILLWILQVLLALHTIMGAVWKFSHSVPSLKAIPRSGWVGLSVVELLFSVCLILPALSKHLALLAPVAAIGIATEMLLFCGVHLYSGDSNKGQMIYWLVVALVSGFIAYGRLG